VVVLAVVVVGVYGRVFGAGFVAFDDDFQVYANPFLNPPSWASVGRFWGETYKALYVPLAYTILAAVAGVARVPAHLDAALGESISLDPMPFHVAGVVLHLANVWLCLALVRRLTGRPRAAFLCALLFALHPLQVESVAWVSELRGLTSSFFALLALNAFARCRVVQNRPRSAALLAASSLCVAAAMLCKPSAAVLPLAALAIDRLVFRTAWRRALGAASIWAAVVVPFVWITRATQPVPAAGRSLVWQRPFVAGHSLAFYVFKLLWPFRLGVDYGRTPAAIMAQAWGYLAWLVPVALLAAAYRCRQRRPFIWLGALLALIFLLPTSGLVPFAYQAYSTVADRYAYLALIGVGLMAADALESLKPRALFVSATGTLAVALAVLTFGQTGHWLTSRDFLDHTIDVNPAAAFAYNNRGDLRVAEGDLRGALADYQAAVARDPTHVKARINLAEAYTALDQPADAARAAAEAASAPDLTSDDLSNLGIVLMRMNQPDRALQMLTQAVALDPTSPTYLFNQANALAAVAQFDQAEASFRRCVALAPTLAGAHTGLGIVLAQTGRLPEAIAEFRTALQLQPDDPAARDNLQRAELMQRRAR
jgi:protein O-mannosyl-transferase